MGIVGMIQNKTEKIIWRVGLTGGIASGKSTVSRYLKEHGEYVIDADLVSREIVEPPSSVLIELQTQFGCDILLKNGSLDRKKLGAFVFGNAQKLEKLNAIMFPAIWDRINQIVDVHIIDNPTCKRLFIDAAVLLESGGLDYVDEVWLVVCDEEQQLQRLMLRDGLNRTQAMQRLKAQWPLEKKRAFADVVLDNSFNEENLFKQIDRSIERLNEGGKNIE